MEITNINIRVVISKKAIIQSSIIHPKINLAMASIMQDLDVLKRQKDTKLGPKS